MVRVPFPSSVIFFTCLETFAVSLFKGHQVSTHSLLEALLVFILTLLYFSLLLFFQVPPTSWFKEGLVSVFLFSFLMEAPHFNVSICASYLLLYNKQSQNLVAQNSIHLVHKSSNKVESGQLISSSFGITWDDWTLGTRIT